MQAHEKSFRREKRYKTSRPILFRMAGKTDFKPAQVHNVSHHGILMQTSEHMEIGDEAEVIISPFDCAFDPVRVTVEVVHMQSVDNTHSQGFGCKVISSTIIENIEFVSDS